MPQRKIYADAAERQKAYRERSKKANLTASSLDWEAAALCSEIRMAAIRGSRFAGQLVAKSDAEMLKLLRRWFTYESAVPQQIAILEDEA